MKLFDDPPLCGHGRQIDECPWCSNVNLARSDDPSTSKAAAASIDLTLSERHQAVHALYRDGQGRPDRDVGLTDDEGADLAVSAGIVARHEQARRLIRTLREAHGLLVPVIGADGRQAERTNASGRRARAWKAAP